MTIEQDTSPLFGRKPLKLVTGGGDHPTAWALPLVDATQWIDREPPGREFVVDGWLARGTAALLVGEDGVGKSLLAQQLATCVAADHRLLVEAQFADLVEKQHALVGGAQQPRTVGNGTGKSTLAVAEQRRHRATTLQCRAIHFDERAGDLMLEPFAFIDAARQQALACGPLSGGQINRTRGSRSQTRADA